MKKSDLILTGLIFVGLIAGVLVGQFLLFSPGASPEAISQAVAPWEDAGKLIFFRPLQMMILPIVFVSVVVGVASIGNPERLGVLGLSTLTYYIGTMMLAIIVGLGLVTWIAPGEGLSPEQRTAIQQSVEERLTDKQRSDLGSIESQYQRPAAPPVVPESLEDAIDTGVPGDASAATSEPVETTSTSPPNSSIGALFLQLGQRLIPTNPVTAAAEGNTLGIIFFSIMLGLALVAIGPAGEPVIKVFDGLFDAIITLVRWIIWAAPLGVFLLVASKVGAVGLGDIVGPIASYMGVVLLGLAIHAFVTLPLSLFIFARVHPLKYMWALRKPLIFAFSTASSGATMPVTIEECQKSGECSEQATNFVIPLGATINMDGTALYQGVAVVFLFQFYGADLAFGDLLVILVTATFAAIGTAAVPNAGLITMAIVITAVNTSLVAMGKGDMTLPLSAIGLIFGIDRILDMCRTSVNVWGDAVGARIMTRLAPDDEREDALG